MTHPLLLLLSLLPACAAAPAPTADAADDVAASGRLAARYVHPPHDPARHLDTCKVYHHVFGVDGRQLTKGLGGSYEHHRGLIFGFNQLQRGAERLDFWHCRSGETQQHERFVDPGELGLDGDWQAALIAWKNGKGELVLHERRAMRATAIDDRCTALDVVIELTAPSPVQLLGDPQHSGHQFRALQEFAEPDATPVRFLRPPTATGGNNDVWRNCDWIAAVLSFREGPVTVLRIEGAGNPQPATWSTRSYGRLGATFTAMLQPMVPLVLRYRYVIALGQLDAGRCALLARAFRAASARPPR